MSDSETRIDARLVAGRYRLVSELGRGGMGTVWLADDTLTGRRVAVKELRPPQGSSDEDRKAHPRRALAEARSSARISHPNAVTLYDVIPATSADDAIYLIMELVEGPTLARLVHRRGALPESEVARFGLQLLDVLEAAHGLGIVHRDIKPGNVLIARGNQAKLTDFGIAHVVGGTRLTRGGTAGTLAYMAPELFAGQPIAAAGDLWSLGVTLFYAADGRVPFERDNDAATMHAILNEEVPVPRCVPALAAAISGLLRRDPAQRFGIEQARDSLSQVTAHESATSAPAAPSAPPQWPTQDGWAAPPVQEQPVPEQPGTAAPQQRLPWEDTGAAGLWAGATAGMRHAPQARPPDPPSRRPSRTTIMIAAAAAVVVVAGAITGVLLAAKSGPGPGPLSLRATLTTPGAGPASSVAFSPDGRTLISTDNANSGSATQNGAPEWNTATRGDIASLPYSGISNDVTFSSDGKLLAIAGSDLYVYNAPSHVIVRYEFAIFPQCAAFSPDGGTVAAGGQWKATSSQVVRLLDVATGRWSPPLPGMATDPFVSAVAFSPNGTMLAASDSANNEVYVWNAASRSLLTTLRPGSGAGPLAFSRDGKTLAVGGASGQIRLWNTATRAWTATLTDPQSKGVKAIAFSPDGKTLAAADQNGNTDLWNTGSGTLIGAQKVTAAGVDDVAFSPDGKTLATGDGSGRIRLWAYSGR